MYADIDICEIIIVIYDVPQVDRELVAFVLWQLQESMLVVYFVHGSFDVW